MRTATRLWILPLSAVIAGCDHLPTAAKREVASRTEATAAPAVADWQRTRGELAATIRDLTALSANPGLRGRSTFGTTWGRAATVDEVLGDLRNTLQHLDAEHGSATRGSREDPGEASATGNPQAGGSSWIEVSAPPGTMRTVKYRAYTACIDCYPSDYPKGIMRVRQYAGSVVTLSIDRTFSGGQGYTLGEVTTTLTGNAQTGTAFTDHWIDVWLGPDPHYYSSASAQV